jgi:hypothetical protein
MGKSLQQLLVTNFALNPSGYTGSRGDIGYVGSAGAGASVPKIASIAYPGDDTAADVAGGQTITITGTGFATGVSVIVNGVTASVVSFINSTTITFTAPAVTAGSYIVYVVNTDGSTALAVPGIQYSGTPAWSTPAGSLGTAGTQISFTANLTATGDAPISYSVYAGTLPTGLTLTANTGVISGTTPNVVSDTTYNFTIRSTDAQQQDTDRAFSITIVSTLPAEYLVVAGGGGGGSDAGGGGGAGGLLYNTSYSIVPGQTYTVTVGAGGPNGGGNDQPTDPANRASNGANSSITGTAITSVIALGGGYGGMGQYQQRGGGTGAGGSGGGGGGSYPNSGQGGPAGVGTAGQGFNGAAGLFSNETGGGGGGAGQAGQLQNGGNGLQNSITGSAIYYAGGGGAGGWTSSAYEDGYGGLGGGGAGGGYGTGGNKQARAGFAGTANTGGGGGAGNQASGANGGSGVVVIRYPNTYSAAASTTGSPIITNAGGYRIYQWTTSGSVTF